MMKKLVLTFLILIGGTGAAFSKPIDTLHFDINLLEIDYFNRLVQYSDFDQFHENDRPAVPGKKVFYNAQLINDEILFYAKVLKADTLDLGFIPILSEPDITTSERERNIRKQSVLALRDGLYPSQVLISTELTFGSSSSWSMTIFPVQFLNDDKIVFNRQIEILTVNNSPISIAPGLPETIGQPNLNLGQPYSKASVTANGCPLGIDFVIVTSLELEDAYAEFLDLKLRTGFNAGIAITDSIFDNYSGIDQAEALRNYLHDFYLAGGRYVLLGGDEEHVPVRYAYYYNTSTVPDLEYLMICDLYFADYTGDWDFDGDGVWGEPTQDHPDMGPEVALGRLPFNSPAQVSAYTLKLERYLFNPGQGNFDYLGKATFFTSDQMRDYFEGGQQYYVGDNFPEQFTLDLENLGEAPNGNDPAPTGPTIPGTVENLDQGFGIVNILAHGRPDGFVLKSSGYNVHPKTYLLTDDGYLGHASFDNLAGNQKSGFYYSISCEHAAFDLEALYSMTVPSVVEKLLEIDSIGAVGMVAFSRWGWVASSYKLMASFYRHLFDDASGYPVEAMYRSWLDYPYYRDQIYGQNFHGDPSIKVYGSVPSRVELSTPSMYDPNQPLNFSVSLNGSALADQAIVYKIGDDYGIEYSDASGNVVINLPDNTIEDISVTAFVPGQVSNQKILSPSIIADADDDDPLLPLSFELSQNYPNPFNPSTTIKFAIAKSGPVLMAVYDILGRVVNILIDERRDAGRHEVAWNGTDRTGTELASGIYFYRLVTGDEVASGKMILLK